MSWFSNFSAISYTGKPIKTGNKNTQQKAGKIGKSRKIPKSKTKK